MFRRQISFLVATALFAGLISSLTASNAAAASEIGRRLNDQYKGKTLILRGFYTGDYLKYDASGRAIDPGSPGDWTVSGIVNIESLKLKSHELIINARRLHLGWPNGNFQELHDTAPKLTQEEGNRALRIEASFNAATPEAVDGLFGRVFLTSSDRFADLVPEYWRSCVRASVTNEADHRLPGCRFASDFMLIPGVSAGPIDDGTESATKPSTDDAIAPAGAGKGGTAPRVVFHQNPSFTNEARRARYSGTVELSLFVDESGHPRDVQIVRPAGMGLDRNAVAAVSQWRFTPGTKDGSPVPAKITVEVDFHLD